MKKCIKFLIVFVSIFIISMLVQLNVNKVMAAGYLTRTSYTHDFIEYRWHTDGYWVVYRACSDRILKEIDGEPVKEIGDLAFFDRRDITSITIPDSIEIIGESAFSSCEELESITIPGSVKIIGKSAFFECHKLSMVELNEGLEEIGKKAFWCCKNLTSIVIPDSVQNIGSDAFDVYNTNYGRKFTMYGSKNSVAETFAQKYPYIIFLDKYMPFSDISSSKWYYNAIKYVFAKKIMTGYTDTKFVPNDKVTRGMFITILYKKEGAPYAAQTNQFIDVSSEQYYAKAVTWGVNNGIINGYDSTHFGPEDYITREQIAVILQQYCKYKGDNSKSTGDLTTFSDYKNVSDYATWGMKWAVNSGVITGSNGRLLPKAYATRAETAAMMQKYCYSFK